MKSEAGRVQGSLYVGEWQPLGRAEYRVRVRTVRHVVGKGRASARITYWIDIRLFNSWVDSRMVPREIYDRLAAEGA